MCFWYCWTRFRIFLQFKLLTLTPAWTKLLSGLVNLRQLDSISTAVWAWLRSIRLSLHCCLGLTWVSKTQSPLLSRLDVWSRSHVTLPSKPLRINSARLTKLMPFWGLSGQKPVVLSNRVKSRWCRYRRIRPMGPGTMEEIGPPFPTKKTEQSRNVAILVKLSPSKYYAPAPNRREH